MRTDQTGMMVPDAHACEAVLLARFGKDAPLLALDGIDASLLSSWENDVAVLVLLDIEVVARNGQAGVVLHRYSLWRSRRRS